MLGWIRQSALSRAQEKHGATHHAIFTVQYLDGSTYALAEGAAMSASANSQKAENRVKNTTLQPLDDTVGADVSSDATCGSMPPF